MNDNRRQNGSSGSPDAAAWFVRLQRHPHDAAVRRLSRPGWSQSPQTHAWTGVSSSWDGSGRSRMVSRCPGGARAAEG